MQTNTTYRQKDSGWQIIISYKDANGKWHQISRQGFATKRDAKAAEYQLKKQIKKIPVMDHSMTGITLLDFCTILLKVKKSISSRTHNNYRSAVKSLGSLAKKPIANISFLDIQSAVSEWTIKPTTQRQYICILHNIFKAAIKPYGLLAVNPATDIEIQKDRDNHEKITITEDQFHQLQQMAKNPAAKLAIILDYYTGLRKSELFALTWNDIDYKDGTITVSKQLDIKRNYIPLKSKNGYRTIPVPQMLIRILREYHTSMPLDYKKRIFPHPVGTLYTLQNYLKLVDKKLTLHCLRHTYATTLLARGMDVRTVAALLGDDTKTVIQNYIHYSDEMREAAAKNIERIFNTI